MQRAKIVLLAADGQKNKDIAAQIGTTPLLVGRWRKRFVKLGLQGIVKDAPSRGRKPVARDAVAASRSE